MTAIGKKCNTSVKSSNIFLRLLNSLKAVTSVIRRHRRAVESISDARESFEALTNAAPLESIDVWKATIEEAEAARSHDHQAMDVMQSRIKTSQSLKAITSAVMQEDLSSRNYGADGNPITDWILEGLNIEDEQCVFQCCIVSY
jgi:hypothetical protein